jgi:hypothetical protein
MMLKMLPWFLAILVLCPVTAVGKRKKKDDVDKPYDPIRFPPAEQEHLLSITITPYLVDGGVPVIDQDRLDGCAEVMNGLHADLQMRYADDQVTQSHVLHSLCRCLLHRATCSPRHIHQAKLAGQEADGPGCYAHSVTLTAPRSSLVPHHSMLATPCSHNQCCESVSAAAVQKDSVSSVGFSCSL